MPAGYYASNSLAVVDTDLVSTNIRGGSAIFGVTGSRYAPTAKTGQQTSYRAGDDGNLKPGVAWPSPRFTAGESGDATNAVRDNLTGLVWARDANMRGATATWNDAVDYCNALNYGGRSDWRLPTRFELESLLDLEKSSGPVLPTGHPFVNIFSGFYFSSSTYMPTAGGSYAWAVDLGTGRMDRQLKTSLYYVWPVAAGE
jgi:hypothetical protein